MIAVPRAEYGSVGFDGSFEGAASIVPAAAVRGMKPAAGDARWRVSRRNEVSHRVLWSDRHQVAMKLESQRDDGSVHRTVSVQIQAPDASRRAPWRDLGGYAQKRYDDFMD